MPQPAEPPPRMAMRWSCIGTPVTLIAASSAPVATAAVPWMSSLKLHNAVAVAVEHARGVALGEVFPLQHDMRPALGQRGDEFGDE